jgi:predicted GNAT superfamily acetyltransferase
LSETSALRTGPEATLMTSSIQIRKCTTLDEFHRCVEIQRQVWGESDLETEPYVTFVVANQTGGQVLGAFEGGTMVGFSMSLVGLRGNTPYLHSHMTGVLAEYRDRHVGRQLKLFQREEALSRDIRLVEWTFDPLETRNAYFNFNRLGGICRKIIPNFYGITSSALHRGLPTDRLLVEWNLTSRRVIAAISDIADDRNLAPATIHLPPEVEQWKQSQQMDRLAEVQSRIRGEFQHWFAKQYAVTAIRVAPGGVDYCLSPWSDF